MGAGGARAARAEQKPIFLSIGYSACHWCHVMAHESFEDPDIARLLNEHFVSIKVDREERPDLDQIYMEAVQTMTGRGGWPMSVFLTPEVEAVLRRDVLAAARARRACPASTRCLRPWPTPGRTAATNCGGRPSGSRSLLRDAARRHGARRRLARAGGTSPPLSRKSARRSLAASFDPQHGGFGPAPKFPQPLALRWLLRRLAPHGRRRLAGNGHDDAWTAWPPAGCSIISAAGFTATASTPGGWCRISRRCSTTTPCWRSATSRPGRPPASRAMPRSCGKRSTICSAT